jgi:hypothetical protein
MARLSLVLDQVNAAKPVQLSLPMKGSMISRWALLLAQSRSKRSGASSVCHQINSFHYEPDSNGTSGSYT